MAYILCDVDDLKEVGKEAEHRELEGVMFRDEKGNTRIFKIKAMLPMSTNYFKSLYPDTDWDMDNPHVAIVLDGEVK